MKVSSGFIVYRINNGNVEFFVGHPGGPYYKNKEYFTFLKGEKKDALESLFDNAKREFLEESGLSDSIFSDSSNYKYLGFIKQNKKFVHAFLTSFDIDPNICYSNNMMIEYPKNSNVILNIPEIDMYRWMSFEELKDKTHPLHIPLYEKAINIINELKND